MYSTNSSLLILGCVSDPSFHRCCAMLAVLAEAGIPAKIWGEAIHDTQFEEILSEKKKLIGGKIFEHTARHLVLQDGGRKYVGGMEELIQIAQDVIVPRFDRTEDDAIDWIAIARRECEAHLILARRPLVYMDIASDLNRRPKRVVYQLCSQDCPRTCENFRALCTGEKGKSADGQKLSFKGCPFHRVVRDGWIQGGDIVSGAGEGGCSIYGGVFGDETFAVKLDEAGTLAMANDGPHTNASQFLVTLAPQPWLNHKVVGFGRVIMGMEVFRQMSEVDTLNQRPTTDCKISKCGQMTPAEFATIACK